MPKPKASPKRSRSKEEEYVPRWDKTDDIEDVMELMWGGRETTGVIPTGVVLTPPVMTPVDLTGVNTTAVDLLSTAEERHEFDAEVTAEPKSTSVITTPVVPTPVKPTPVKRPPVEIQSVSIEPGVRPYVVHRCMTAEEGHSRTEHQLYQILWRNARSVTPDDACRLASIPQSDLARAMAGMTTKNLRHALGRLEEKLSIEQATAFDAGKRSARVWKVYSTDEILRRREAAGLTHAVRDKGVRFVDPGRVPQRASLTDN